MQIKQGGSWKAAYNEEKNVYGAEVIFQGSWDCYEIDASVYNRLTKGRPDREAEELIETGRLIYRHVNDRCGPPYTIELDENYLDYCPWMNPNPVGKKWDKGLTEAAKSLLGKE